MTDGECNIEKYWFLRSSILPEAEGEGNNFFCQNIHKSIFVRSFYYTNKPEQQKITKTSNDKNSNNKNNKIINNTVNNQW